MNVAILVNGQTLNAVLFDTASARHLLAMLPLQLAMEDYAGNEKIGFLPRKLTLEGSGPFGDEAIGDIAYYSPWGNLAIFYGKYRYSSGLVRLGRIEDPIAPLLIDGPFNMSIKPR